ncbi:MAG: biopolymer transporter ExbD [Sphingobacteriaceae bacterium]|nr:biopolymer transporter ExbD [Sphingobacteriaceae bacterium]
MAELNNMRGVASGRSVSSKKLPKVDLTAMVDLAFLLITFFMLTTTLSRPSEMKVSMPVDKGRGEVPDTRSMAVCLGAGNKMLWYMGTTANPREVNVTNASGLRNALLKQMKHVSKTTGKSLIVLVKPGDRSRFKNLVDVLDELAISQVPTYAIIDITPEDKKMLAEKTIL